METKSDFDHKRGRWFTALPQAMQDDILRSSVRIKLRRGKHLFRQGDEPAGLFGIVSGEAQVIGTTLAGLDILVAVYRPGEWTGFLACIDGGGYTLSVVASQPCEVLHLPLPAVRRIFFNDVDSLTMMVAPELATLRSLYFHITEQLAFTPLQRLARRLVDLASSAQAQAVTSRTISPITQDQLALSVMASRQWTNRLLQHLEKTGLITRGRSRIDVLDLPRLNQLALHGESGFTMADPMRADLSAAT
ncbi:MAG: Crp/Fnr family transcriptional regulator [Acidobacteria bacterium]|nr:Crp/Fnr family transcriptional regulator [Acidobacteriota bacterium]